MASSSSSHQPLYFYQVFLSFRGEDTRHGFTSHLLKALKDSGIRVFLDDQELKKGEELCPELLKAITASKISIVILSKDYASSKSCLTELSKIMECKLTQEQKVIPVFYHVNPSHVRHHSGSFEQSFNRHYLMGKPDEVLERWKAAFTQVGNLKGFHIQGDRSESEYIEKIVEDVIEKLSHMGASNVSKGLVGINERKDKIIALLDFPGGETRRVGIWGTGGIGKTTLAEAVYNEVSPKFSDHYFLHNVREKLKSRGMHSLRDEFLSQLLKQEVHIDTPSLGYLIRDRLHNKRVFVVIDDVDNMEQLECFGYQHFGHGSKIMVTSRDRQVLVNGEIDEICKVKELNEHHSHQLFSKFAFKQDNIPLGEFRDLSNSIVKYAGGLPLALKVLGAALYRKSCKDWEGAIRKLKEYPERKIIDVLKISFEGLDELEKDIFLDIACLLKDELEQVVYVTELLNSCYEGAEFGVSNLVDRCLVDVSDSNELRMHDLLRQMGWDIVRKESKDPGKRSRIWSPKDVYHVLKDNKGTETIEGIALDMSQIDDLQLCPAVFEKMINLRVVKFYFSCRTGNCNKLLLADQPLKSLPNQLKLLCWDSYPCKSLPSNFSPTNLVELNLGHGNIQQLWHGDQDLVNLKVMNLSHCESLVELPCLRHLTSLKYLNLLNCSKINKFPEVSSSITHLYLGNTGIEEVPDSIQHLVQLRRLLLHSSRVKYVSSNISKLESGFTLSLSDCPINQFPEIPTNLIGLNLSWTQIEQVPSSIGCLSKLNSLLLRGTKIRNLPSSVVQLDVLDRIDLSGCLNITEFQDVPEGILELHLDETSIPQVPSSATSRLERLSRLSIRHCKSLQSLFQLPPCLGYLNARDCISLQKVSFRDQYRCELIEQHDFIMFSNCFNLNQDAIDNIVANAMLRIGYIAKQLAQLLQELSEELHVERGVVCCFPESEISNNFEYQNTNSSITLKLISPDKKCPIRNSGRRFLGFALCLVIDLKHHHKYLNSDVLCEYQLQKAQGGEYKNFERLWKYWDWDPCYKPKPAPLEFSGHHALLLFSGNMIHEDMDYKEASFQFFVTAEKYNDEERLVTVDDIKVEKCGVHAFYEYA